MWDDFLTLRRVESWWSYYRTGREQDRRAEARVTIHNSAQGDADPSQVL